MWILRLNMSDRTYRLEEVPEAYKNLGGRGMTSTLVHDEVPPLCHPLGPNNKLVFAPGIVTGTAAPTSSRVSVGAKSPLTGGIKESNAGSPWPQYLAWMQIKALVVEGQPKEKGKYWTAYLTWDDKAGKPKVEFSPADRYKGQDLYEVYPKVFKRFGKGVAIAGFGVAAEYGYANSGIVFNFQRQLAVDVLYKGYVIQGQRLDLLIENEVVVEVKSLRTLPDVATAQLLSYLKATGLKRGLLLNFGEK